MGRLILIVIFFVIVVMAVFSVMAAIRTAVAPTPSTQGDTMPKTFSKIAYVALIILMFGVTAGFLGAA